MRQSGLLHFLMSGLASWLLCTASTVPLAATSRHRVTLDDLERLESISELELSPTGEALVYVANGDDIWFVPVRKGGSPRRLGKGMLPIWSPDGKRIGYYSSASGTNQLWVIDVGTGLAERVTNLQGGIDPNPWTSMIGASGSVYDALLYSWSPDGRKLVFSSQVVADSTISTEKQSRPGWMDLGSNTDAPLVLTGQTPPELTLAGVLLHGVAPIWATWEQKKPSSTDRRLTANQLFIVDTYSKELHQVTKDGDTYFTPDWSPDGQTIVCVSTQGRPLTGWGSATTGIYALDVRTGTKTALTTAAKYIRVPRWSPDGKWIAYAGSAEATHQSLFVIPRTGGTPVDVTSGLDRAVSDFRWFSDGQTLLVHYVDGVSSRIARTDIHGGRFQEITLPEDASRSSITVSRTGVIGWQQSDGTTAATIRVLPYRTAVPYTLVDLNPQIEEWDLGVQEVVRWKNRHGEEVEGVLLKPAGYQKGHVYPLIVDVYPTYGSTFKGSPMWGNQAWVSQGYAVFFPDPRAPHTWMRPFKTDAYDQAARGPEGWNVTVDDVTTGVDELVRRGIVDPNRIGLYGFSNGGGVVDYLVTATARFKCAISVAPVYPDWSEGFFLQTFSIVPMFAGGIAPWDNPAGYISLSAVYRLDRVVTPMLLAVGDSDNKDFVLGSIELYNGLRYLGKDVTLLRYPNQGHVLTGDALKDFWRRENVFFDTYLKSDQQN